MRTDLPDEALQRAVDASRGELLLDASAWGGVGVCAVLEDWGFDTEAAMARRRLGSRGRRAASRRDPRKADPWTVVRTRLSAASPVVTLPGGPAPFLRIVRELIVEEAEGRVDMMPAFPPEWLGRDLAVHGVPVSGGTLSFALRWHGERPALLWDAPAGLTVTSSRLDPRFNRPGGKGEMLLARPPESLGGPVSTAGGSTSETVT